jgi:hypothetical protein
MAKKKKKATRQSAEAPTSSCLLICEDVFVGAGSAKHILHGIISEIFVPALPVTIVQAVAYVRLTNVYAEQNIALSFANVGTGVELFRFNSQSPKDSNPLGTHTLILKIPPFEITETGRYIFSALHNDIAFAECPVTVKVPEQTE